MFWYTRAGIPIPGSEIGAPSLNVSIRLCKAETSFPVIHTLQPLCSTKALGLIWLRQRLTLPVSPLVGTEGRGTQVAHLLYLGDFSCRMLAHVSWSLTPSVDTLIIPPLVVEMSTALLRSTGKDQLLCSAHLPAQPLKSVDCRAFAVCFFLPLTTFLIAVVNSDPEIK